MSDEITPPGGTWPEDDPLSFVDDEPPEPRSLLGLPVRLLLALGGFAVPLLAVAWFAASHDWPPPPPCGLIAVFGCAAAPFPLAVQSADWLDLAGPGIGLALAVGALAMRKDPAEGGILWTLLVRFALPVVGLVVSVGCAIQLWSWINQ
jgi:hypothetical protein